jgi:hypothetical protein
LEAVRRKEGLSFESLVIDAGHPQMTPTAFRASSINSARRPPARARIAIECIVADASMASAAGFEQRRTCAAGPIRDLV